MAARGQEQAKKAKEQGPGWGGGGVWEWGSFAACLFLLSPAFQLALLSSSVLFLAHTGKAFLSIEKPLIF